MSMATPKSLGHKQANLLSSVDKAALFDQIWNDDSSEMMVLAQLIFDCTGSSIDYEILDVNSAGEKVSGFPREQVLGRRLREIFPGCDLKWPEEFGEIVRFSRTLSGSEPAVTPYLVYELKIFPLNTETRLITVSQSLTRLKHSQMLQMQMLAQVKEAILVVNENETIIDCNVGATKILGWPKEELIGQPMFFFTENYIDGEEMIGKSVLAQNTWADLGKRQDMLQVIADQGYIRNAEYEFRKKSGETGTVLASINTLDINGEKCLLISA